MHPRTTLLLAALALVACAPRGAGDAGDAAGGDVVSADLATGPDGTVPAQCDQASDCTACSMVAGCGWCIATHACLAASADETQSADGTCAGSGWDYVGASCSGPGSLMDRCATMGAAGCGACTLVDSCGWCRAEARCVPGGVDGTASYDGACSGADWSYLPSDCPGYDGGAVTGDSG